MKSLTFIDLAANNGDIVGWESRKCERPPAARLATFPTLSRIHVGSWSTKKQKTNITRSQRIGPQAATEESRILYFVRGDSTPQNVEKAAATALEKQPQHLNFDPQGCRLLLSSMSIKIEKNIKRSSLLFEGIIPLKYYKSVQILFKEQICTWCYCITSERLVVFA